MPDARVARRQGEVLQLFTALLLIQPEWSGTFLLGVGLHAEGASLALASLAAGAASLWLEEDPARIKQANREGVLTFSVTSLDEALRALKNEVRKGTAITVGLSGAPDSHLREAVERGLQPAFLWGDIAQSEGRSLLTALENSGASRLPPDLLRDPGLSAYAASRTLIEDMAEDLAARRHRDRSLLADSVGDPILERWLRAAASIFPRERVRSLWSPDSGPMR